MEIGIGKVLVAVFLALYLPSQWNTKDLDGVNGATKYRLAWVLVQTFGIMQIASLLGA